MCLSVAMISMVTAGLESVKVSVSYDKATYLTFGDRFLALEVAFV